VDDLQARMVAAVRAISKRRGITITHLPDRAAVSRSHFWEVLGGRTSPTLAWVTRIAKALDVKPIELFRHGDQPTPPAKRKPARRR